MNATATSTIGFIIRAIHADNPSLDDRAVADLVADVLREEDDPVELIFPLIVECVHDERRSKTRSAERRVFTAWDPARRCTGEDRIQAVSELRAQMAAYADEYVSIPGVGRVRVGAATVSEWQARRDGLQDGIKRDMVMLSFVDTVIGELEESKAKCIDAYLRKRR